MKYFEFGKENADLMDMLHGGSACYRGGSTGSLRANIPKNFQRRFRQCIDTLQRRIQEHRKRHDWMGVQEINNIFSEKET